MVHIVVAVLPVVRVSEHLVRPGNLVLGPDTFAIRLCVGRRKRDDLSSHSPHPVNEDGQPVKYRGPGFLLCDRRQMKAADDIPVDQFQRDQASFRSE